MAGVFQRREVTMASILAGSIAVPAGFLFAGILRSCSPLSAGAVLFLPSDPLRHEGAHGSRAGRLCEERQVRKVIWTFFIAPAGFVLALVVDPAAGREDRGGACGHCAVRRAGLTLLFFTGDALAG